MNITFDYARNRLVFLAEDAPRPWDARWAGADLKASVEGGWKNRLAFSVTRRFLGPGNPGTSILEGGCGKGQLVYGFARLGYDCRGVDTARDTVRRVRAVFPDLQVTDGDVCRLDFPAGRFDGYWSVGVIEHFRDGYGPVLREAFRVLRPGGVLFLTFPHLSPLRRAKARRGGYPAYRPGEGDARRFHQFAFDAEDVVLECRRRGFDLVYRRPYDGLKGLKDEVPLGRPLLQRLYDSRGRMGALCRGIAGRFLDRVAGHVILLVLRRRAS